MVQSFNCIYFIVSDIQNINSQSEYTTENAIIETTISGSKYFLNNTLNRPIRSQNYSQDDTNLDIDDSPIVKFHKHKPTDKPTLQSESKVTASYNIYASQNNSQLVLDKEDGFKAEILNYEGVEALESKPKGNTTFKSYPSENFGHVDISLDKDSPTAKVVKFKPEALESASKVIMPVKNYPLNNILKEYNNKNTTESLKHPVENLDENLAKKVLERNVFKKSNIRAHVQYDEVTGEVMSGDHPCHRQCEEGEQPMICYYHFNLEWYQTMSKACYDCPYNTSDCLRPDCIPADGMNRPLNVVNRKMPGPAIEVSSLFLIS